MNTENDDPHPKVDETVGDHVDIPERSAVESEEQRYITFRDRVEELINITSMENGSDTPDFVLANYLAGCLRLFDTTIQARETWYGRPIGGGASIEHVLGDPAFPSADLPASSNVDEEMRRIREEALRDGRSTLEPRPLRGSEEAYAGLHRRHQQAIPPDLVPNRHPGEPVFPRQEPTGLAEQVREMVERSVPVGGVDGLQRPPEGTPMAIDLRTTVAVEVQSGDLNPEVFTALLSLEDEGTTIRLEVEGKQGGEEYSLIVNEPDDRLEGKRTAGGFLWLGEIRDGERKRIPLAGQFIEMGPAHWVNLEIPFAIRWTEA